MSFNSLPLSINIAQKPFIIGSLGPKALKYESFEGKGSTPGEPDCSDGDIQNPWPESP